MGNIEDKVLERFRVAQEALKVAQQSFAEFDDACCDFLVAVREANRPLEESDKWEHELRSYWSEGERFGVKEALFSTVRDFSRDKELLMRVFSK